MDVTAAGERAQPRGLYRRWRQFMEAEDWEELTPWREA